MEGQSHQETMYTEEDPLITHKANKTTLSTNTCIKLQSLALAGRHQGYINLQSPLCNPRILKSKAHKYKSPECKFCHLDAPEDTIHIIGECLSWNNLRTARNNKLKDMANLKGVNLPQDMFLESNLNYSLPPQQTTK